MSTYPESKSKRPFDTRPNELGFMWNRWGLGQVVPVIGHIVHIVLGIIYWQILCPFMLIITWILNLLGIRWGPITLGGIFYHIFTGRSVQTSVNKDSKETFKFVRKSGGGIFPFLGTGPLFWYNSFG